MPCQVLFQPNSVLGFELLVRADRSKLRPAEAVRAEGVAELAL